MKTIHTNEMNFQAYLTYFESILTQEKPLSPYDKSDYFNYTKLNWSRTNRWLKHGELIPEINQAISRIKEPQQWLIITEPWCGDASHIVPFLQMIADLNPLITVDYELRDQEPFRINDYLTNGGKAIPKLIIRNEAGEDLATWGPRPADCQVLYQKLSAEKADFETVKIALQKWYNDNKGVDIQEEIIRLLDTIN
ncbi:MAG TPA: thioredoxin family protein [Fluviicola sp.]|nr:thioredoxin family protein [Fluviicola sp.]